MGSNPAGRARHFKRFKQSGHSRRGFLSHTCGDVADLVRVLGPIPELARIWRLLTTAELRRTPRVAAFFDFIVEEIDALKPILTG